MFNAANTAFGTTVFCDKPTQDFHSATRLLLPNVEGRNSTGLLCNSIVKPPVNILFCLPKPVDLRAIIIKPDVARHRVTHLSIFLRKECNKRDRTGAALQVSRPGDIIRRLEQLRPIASVNLDKHPEGSVVLLHTHQKRLLPPCAFPNNAPCIYECEVSQAWNGAFHNVRFVLIRICRLASASCVPCLGAVELWCVSPPDYIESVGVSDTRRVKQTETVDSGCSYTNLPHDEGVVNSRALPDDFVDALTGELMREPVRLPSGNCIDRSSLNRFWTERLANCPHDPRPVDPFTMVSFDERSIECDGSLKQAISDYLDRCKQLGNLCSRLDNWAQVSIPLTSTVVPQLPTSSESEGD
ncbi:hypothetical protein EG68_09372 [Paragonimus skrjabini miyazakii]|uniref:U-box domain-containing protein n=1 Tax=Paragonimus skrjabini miyazakii TaxID=59628 RepID=A0A8S9YT02_9TREM|nr:hypothetical protein EG68_09372 [Paragonimus skrjabini miyazakii]